MSYEHDQEHRSDEEIAQSELQSLASLLAASKKAMGVLGSALADHVVGALQAQGLVPTQQGSRSDKPYLSSRTGFW